MALNSWRLASYVWRFVVSANSPVCWVNKLRTLSGRVLAKRQKFGDLAKTCQSTLLGGSESGYPMRTRLMNNRKPSVLAHFIEEPHSILNLKMYSILQILPLTVFISLPLSDWDAGETNDIAQVHSVSVCSLTVLFWAWPQHFLIMEFYRYMLNDKIVTMDVIRSKVFCYMGSQLATSCNVERAGGFLGVESLRRILYFSIEKN